LLIFDCDGVLVDSEAIVIEIETHLLGALGVEVTAEDVGATCVGLSEAEIRRRIEDRWQIRLPADFDDEKRARITDAFKARLTPVAGIPQLLSDVSGPRCVASSSPPARIRSSLELARLIEYFDPHLYSAAMVTRGKPEPDLFLYAAARMDWLPEAAVVIEDSPYGVVAGRAANMKVIGFTGASHCSPSLADDLRNAGAHHVARDAPDLQRILAAL
jgi:HAD superfamily hydrolase (TIGR01509 family)